MNTKQKRPISTGIAVIAMLCISGAALAYSLAHRAKPEIYSAEISAVPPVSSAETTAESTAAAETTAAETETAAPKAEDTRWMLTLVNSTHPLPENFSEAISLVQLSNGISVDARIYPALQEMFDDMRSSGIYPTVREGFRTHAAQQDILLTRIRSYKEQGYSEDEAYRLARAYVAEPGTSEHELGLAVDINAASGSSAETVYTWLAENAHRYGFILRYPEGKSEITGISYEPWHYRYVGKDAAAEIFTRQITLEEYLSETQ